MVSWQIKNGALPLWPRCALCCVLPFILIPCSDFTFEGDRTDATDSLESGFPSLVGLRAPCASSEDLTFREEDDETDEDNEIEDDNELKLVGGRHFNDDPTPTPSISLCSTPSPNCGSLAATPVHQPKQDISLCSPEK